MNQTDRISLADRVARGDTLVCPKCGGIVWGSTYPGERFGADVQTENFDVAPDGKSGSTRISCCGVVQGMIVNWRSWR